MIYAISSDTIGHAHKHIIDKVLKHGFETTTEDGEETLELATPLVVEVKCPTSHPMIYKLGEKPVCGFSSCYMEEYSHQMMSEVCNGFAYTYGERIRNYDGLDQLGITIAKLLQNNSTRRAIIHTWKVEKDIYGKHVPCLQTIQFVLRENKLNCVATFRSNDMLMAWGCNAFGIARMMQVCAFQVNAEVGFLNTFSACAHIYHKRDASVLERIRFGEM